ncbi:MAG: 30S ribosomal protein S5 [Coxiellaceae bacterium]|jgi:small subunit ribosomal protein S5|nr:30S ribosomal protein S5 [Coxiellaceae bacterium]
MVDNNTANELREKLVSVRRTAKVVKGGRIFGFAAMVVIGDGRGKIGFGLGKSREVPSAIQKAIEQGKRNMIRIPLKGNTIQHSLIGRYGATKIIIIPASEGTGLISGGAVRAVCEVIGVRDILSKCVGARNPVNVVRATINALTEMTTLERVVAKRGLKDLVIDH